MPTPQPAKPTPLAPPIPDDGVSPVLARDYHAWTTRVTRWGGAGTAAPDGTGRVAAAYSYRIYGPAVNGTDAVRGRWAMPDYFSANGQTGYYLAPQAVQASALALAGATDAEAERAVQQAGGPAKVLGLPSSEDLLGYAKVGLLVVLALVAVSVVVPLVRDMER